MRRSKNVFALLIAAMLCLSATACGDGFAPDGSANLASVLAGEVPLAAAGSAESEYVADFDEAAAIERDDIEGLPVPAESGTAAVADFAVVDYGNAGDGYFLVKCTSANKDAARILRVTAPSGTVYDYVYPTVGEFTPFALSEGSGKYSVALYEQKGQKFSPLATCSFVAETDGFDEFLCPNYYVNFTGASSCVKIAAALTENISDELEKVAAVYHYVAGGMSYDYDLAASVKAGYVPDLERAVEDKTGICFDYASLMTAMLRSTGIPTKLVFGYAGEIYHAWISVYTEENGWINALIRFDGEKWELMDPTFASTGFDNPDEFSADSGNYKSMYVY